MGFTKVTMIIYFKNLKKELPRAHCAFYSAPRG